MNPYLQKLKSALSEQADIPVMEVLYCCYRELHPTDSETITKNFTHLNDVLGKLTLRECDRVWNLTCALCSEHEREGFLEGVHVGAELALELLKTDEGLTQDRSLR